MIPAVTAKKIDAIGPDESKAITDQEWDAWRALPATRRLAGWLTESAVACEKMADECRLRAGKALGQCGADHEAISRDFTEASTRAAACRKVLFAMEAAGEPVAPVPEGEHTP